VSRLRGSLDELREVALDMVQDVVNEQGGNLEQIQHDLGYHQFLTTSNSLLQILPR